MTNEELFKALNARFDSIEKRLDEIGEKLDDIEEDAEVTRYGVNKIMEWADIAGKTINIRIVE